MGGATHRYYQDTGILVFTKGGVLSWIFLGRIFLARLPFGRGAGMLRHFWDIFFARRAIRARRSRSRFPSPRATSSPLFTIPERKFLFALFTVWATTPTPIICTGPRFSAREGAGVVFSSITGGAERGGDSLATLITREASAIFRASSSTRASTWLTKDSRAWDFP